MGKPDRDQITVVPTHESSFWLQLKIRETVQNLTAGLTRDCGHLQHPKTQVGVVALCQPHLIVCQPCTPQLVPDELEDHTCDRCRTYSPEGLHTGAVKPHPMLVIVFGLCRSCQAKEAGQ